MLLVEQRASTTEMGTSSVTTTTVEVVAKLTTSPCTPMKISVAVLQTLFRIRLLYFFS